MTSTPEQALSALRQTAPLVQCITNFVAMNYAANVMLAVGASPAMVHCEEESGDFAAISAALTVNIGTLSPPWVAGMVAAIKRANAAGRPWVLDPVAHFATPYRGDVASRLLALSPDVVRANASEVIALAGSGASGKGVDSGDRVQDAEAAARALARSSRAIIAVTGEVDFVTDGIRATRVHGGSPLMARVTATGCALTCLTGAFLATNDDPFDGTVAALASFAAAGSRAGAASDGPGSFAWRFLDALSDLDEAALRAVPLEVL